MTRITGIRRQLSKELGFVVPPVKVSDDLSLPGNVYRISVAGVIVGEDEVFPNEMLALDSGDLVTKVTGRACKDPTFGLDALWLPKAMQDRKSVVSGKRVSVRLDLGCSCIIQTKKD